MSFTARGAAGAGPNATNGQRPPSRNVNRDSQEGPLVQRTDSSRSMMDPGILEQKTSKDNIRVAVRIRPLSEKEHNRGDTAVWATDGTGGVGLYSTRSSTLSIKYAYDLVFDSGTSNAQVFEHVGRATIEPVTQGISGTLFAYGVTSSGKTHTMMGTAADPGLVPRAIRELFAYINQATDRVFIVTFSMLEIYCEMLNDLLDPSKLNLDVQERELPNGRGAVLQVKGLTEGKVATAEAALAMIQQGLDNRKVGATAYNDQSSRSHTLCRFLVESAPAANSDAINTVSTTGSGVGGGPVTRTSAWLTLVDLAGSEGAKAALSKDQQAEARDINRSLLTLGKVVFELAKGNGHVPFRDSLLTRLLKPSLTGNGAKVAIICNVTPASSQSDETWNTLRFADGAKRIKVSAVKNEALDVAAVVAQYQREVEGLKAQLAALSGAAAAGGLTPSLLQAMQASLHDSSTANTADQLADQEAQMRYLAESNRNLNLERDQLLSINRKMMAMLVEQTRGLLEDCNSSGAAVGEELASLTKHRKSLSFESAQYYNLWQGSQLQQPGQQQLHHQCQAGDSGLIRITDDDVPDSITATTVQTVGHSAQRTLSNSSSSRSIILPAAALQHGEGSSALLAPVVPASVYFPGSRRISKTLALAVPGAAPVAEGAVTAAWLGPVATVSAAAAGCSAVGQAVEAHRKLSECQSRLDLLQQLLDDKEVLLKEARQMQEGQALQLRLTITAADRALLRDKLAEAEQQLASYQSILKEYEAEKEELYDTAYSLYSKVLKLTEQNHTAATEMQQLKSKLAAAFGGASAAQSPALAVGTESMIGRGSSYSASSSPEPPRSGGPSGLVRPRSAAAVIGGRTPGQQQQLPSFTATAGGSAASRYTLSSAQGASSNIGLGRTLPRSPSQSSGVGLSSLNPICISSPFGDTAEVTAAGAAVSGIPHGYRKVRASGTASGASSADGSPGASPSPSVSPTPTLLSAALSTGASRIPLPPCLQQRPKQLQTNDVRLLRFATGHSKLPGAPSSSSSSVASSMGGVLLSSSSSSNTSNWSGVATNSMNSVVGSVEGQLVAGSVQQQSQLSSLGKVGPPSSAHNHRPSNLGEGTSSSTVCQVNSSPIAPSSTAGISSATSSSLSPSVTSDRHPAGAATQSDCDSKDSGSGLAPALLHSANHLKPQPGMLAVAAAMSEDGGSVASGRGLSAEAAATGGSFKKLWQGGLPAVGITEGMSGDDGGDAAAASEDFRIPAGRYNQL